MTTLRVSGPARLAGPGGTAASVEVLADKSVMHRALLFAALGQGPCTISPWPAGADNTSTLHLLGAMGVEFDVKDGELVVHGVGGPQNLKTPTDNLDCGNSGTTMRLMAGVLAAREGAATMVGDASLSARPMSRLKPLEAMGARLSGREVDGKIYPPFTVEGAALKGHDHILKIASAQLKSALLIAGCFAEGTTRVTEPGRSRDHTERMLRFRGVELDDDAGTLSLTGPVTPWTNPKAVRVPPDLSSAAFVLGAGLLTQSPVSVRSGVNPTRSGVIDALKAMGAKIHRDEEEDWGGEPVATLRLEPGPLKGTTIAGELALRSLDELPLLASVAAIAEGTTTIRDAAELRVKESDRIEATLSMLRAVGVQAQGHDDGLTIVGGSLKGGRIQSQHDHRIAMSGAVLGLGAEGVTEIEGFEAALVSFPGFETVLSGLGAEVEVLAGPRD